ncbi:3-phosphoglycerate dehydrogenase (plasmid) [Rhizobium sp. 007]|nr:3-phosphoglycerate dehydrogenase [Rhizobium sp. 007]
MKAGSGLDTIDLEACERRGITVSRTGGSETSVAELTLALMLACLREISRLDQSVRARNFAAKTGAIGGTLDGRTVGIVGFGAIGAKVAKLLAGFGAHILVFDRSIHQTDKRTILTALGATPNFDLDTLLKKAQVLTLHVPLTPATRGLIDERRLSLLPSNAILVNTARAALVDRLALEEALVQKRLTAAGLDVHFEEDGVTNSRLLDLPNVISTPHVGAQTYEAQEAVAGRIVSLIADTRNRLELA